MLPATLVTFTTFLLELCAASPVYNMQPAFITTNIGATNGRNIRNLPCISRKNNGLSGVCMFAIDCLKANGTHLGTCIDRFYFGSCCHIQPVHDIVENTIESDIFPHDREPPEVDIIPHDREPPERMANTTSRPVISSTLASFSTDISNLSTSSSISYSSSTSKTNLISSSTPLSSSSTITTAATSSVTLSDVSDKNRIRNESIISTTVSSSSSLTTDKLSSTTTTKPTSQSNRPFGDRLPSSTVPSSVETTTQAQKLQTFQIVQGSSTFSPTTEVTRPKTTKQSTKTPTRSTVRPSALPNRTTIRPRPTRPSSTQKPIRTTKPTIHKQTQKPFKPTGKPTKTTTRKPQLSTKPTTTRKPGSVKPPKPTKSSTTSRTPPVSSVSSTTSKIPTKKPATTRPTSTLTSVTSKPAVYVTRKPLVNLTASSTISHEIQKINMTQTLDQSVVNTATNEIEPPLSRPVEVSTLSEVSSTSTTTSRPTVPGLVTWTVADEKNYTATTSSSLDNEVYNATTEDWVPITSPDGWVLLPSVPSTTGATINGTSAILQSPTTSIDLSSTSGSLDVGVSSTELGTSPSSTSAAVSSEKTPEVAGTTPTPETITIPPSSANNITSTTPESTSFGEVQVNVTEGVVSASSDKVPTMPVVEVTIRPGIIAPPVGGFGGENSTTTENVSVTTEPSSRPVNMSDFTDVCGRRMFPEARIVGGEKSSFGKWPWQISLRQWRTSTYLHKCGAALLNENWAITAAHCVDNVPPSDLLLRLGEHDLSTDSEPYLHQERRVQIVASHPQFDPRTFEYDLALLRFYEPVTFQPNILPVCVPHTDDNFVGKTAYVTGWGRLYEDGPLPSVLQEVSAPVINNSVCESMYRSAGYIEHIPHIFICAGWRRGGFDSCEGDSGGPMVIQREDKRFLLAGVISWGIGCAEPNQPGVYTRISEFRDWINQILQF